MIFKDKIRIHSKILDCCWRGKSKKTAPFGAQIDDKLAMWSPMFERWAQHAAPLRNKPEGSHKNRKARQAGLFER
ncbi:Uncharacterised protein [Serratia fonticola]|jgi:hypothetical protein|nr:Uncharacterised protein [Serratia fonticola]